ncbi:MAG: 50S ribosomal protein L10 [Elusimicrobia bacterium]|nr:50S ribosomal protein L10 [Elusimicrobiota bacterium]
MRKEKETALQELIRHLSGSSISLFATFKGVSTPELFEAKKKIKNEKALFKVVKKSLLKKALENLAIQPGSQEFWKGEVAALTSANGDPIRVAKALAQWVDESKKISIKGGFLLAEKKWLDPKTVETMAKLPGAKELQAHVVGALAAPIAGLAGVLSAAVAQIILVLNAVRQERERKPEDASQAAVAETAAA